VNLHVSISLLRFSIVLANRGFVVADGQRPSSVSIQ
jgi:hypothetical protein